MKIKAIIFDLDNTLLDFMKMKRQAVRAGIESMIEAGLTVDQDKSVDRIFELYEAKGWENQQIFDIFLEEIHGKVDAKFLAAGIVAYRRAREANLKVYPNVNQTLVSLGKMGLKLAIVSDAPRREAWMRIFYLNLHHVFDIVLTFDDTGVRKPSPKPFEMALDQLSVKADEAIMIGDWPERDVEGAKQLGIKTIYARYGDTFGTVESGADWDINDVSEILDIVNELNRT
ncbi:MAG: TIGR02253 family HAD-type hydrolase [Candidatus Marinimicrobia bacterium]|nr:TIGR02253 family HAD-type hydrolase [Candidatus Neomarinimicrobiota bacterium]MBT3618586.1 TIGR02253 family HAD-type hydrolase [Candidatus Neomarinimicrobiota bacterium]MBT3828813.1 TIGR02253 family HAD-type hydrolase [Candidatus Neomarinimicrobiota bacterium]MBT3996825.1 TIGR02253 family HAD-type hydrolase [Candidatus Neomarinimicrobiota bacterium]MBT4281024.1 TIGR02253 family HAD-type hydrolase [Candidatus Neomarinimicrobiota bacterium]